MSLVEFLGAGSTTAVAWAQYLVGIRRGPVHAGSLDRPREREWRVTQRGPRLSAEHEVDATEDELELLCRGIPADSLCKHLAVERLTNCETLATESLLRPELRFDEYVPRCIRPLKVAGQRHAYDRGDTASVEGIALDHKDRAAEPPGSDLTGPARSAQQTSPWEITIPCAPTGGAQPRGRVARAEDRPDRRVGPGPP